MTRALCALGAALVAGWSSLLPGHAATPVGVLPPHVFAPYFETYLPGDPSALSASSGAIYLTLAFLQTPSRGSCTVDWNGDPTTPVSWSVYGAAITRIRNAGGDVVPSFGGYSADHDGTDIADSCTSVASIAAAYEQVATTYGVSRLDLDVEDRSLNRAAAIDRRNRAIAMAERWAARRHRPLQFVYTIPTNTTGIGSEVNVLQSARHCGARIDIVNIMTFDYYADEPHEMARSAKEAANALFNTLVQLHPGMTAAALWRMVGITEMVGIDDYGPQETFTLQDAATVEQWAYQHHIGELSFWALQRDNGRCPGTAGSNTCSGVAQQRWQFSHIFEPFTSG